MSSLYMNEVEAMIDSMDISDYSMLGAGARTSKRLQECVSTAQSVVPGADKLAKRLSDYNIYKTISTGSSCNVYIGQRAGSCAPVAVKVMTAQKRSKLSKQGLTMEIKCLKKVNASGKRCFVKLVESFVDKYNHYIVFQYVPRGTLWSCVERAGGTIPVTLVRMIMAELADGLLYLKQNRIVHRDIKPENLMIDLFGHIVIVDFGLALIFEDDEPEIAQSGRTVCGTPGYIAPELMDGKEYSYAVDVWSAGCVMYELLVGRRPYEGTSYEDVYRSMQSSHHKFPSKPRVDFLTRSFVANLLEKNPEKRLTVEEMKGMSFFGEIEWDRVAIGDYDPSFYLHFTRERGIPINKAISKATLVNESRIDAEWYPDSEDLQFVVPPQLTAGLLDSPPEPVYDENKENKVENLFYRKPYYVGKQWDEYDEFEDKFRVAHPICSGGSSEFLGEDDDEDDDFLESVNLSLQSTEIQYFPPPHPILRRLPIPGLDFPPKQRSRYVPRKDSEDPYVRQRQNFIAKYGKRLSLTTANEKDQPELQTYGQDPSLEATPVISKRGLCILNIPDLIHSDSCITSASSMPTTPLDYNFPDDAWAPNIRKQTNRSGIRGFLKDLGLARLSKIGLGF